MAIAQSPSSDSMLLRLQGVSGERAGRLLFDQLDLVIKPGEIHQVEGPNGSGKTTLLRGICGLGATLGGELYWRDQPLSKQRDQFRREVLYLGHTTGIKAVLSARESLQWYAALSAPQSAAGIDAALARVGLYGYEDIPCYHLSAGQQRRVALARLFLVPAALWVLDEPFTAIDKQGVTQLEEWLTAHADSGGAVLLTTHHQLTLKHTINRLQLGQSS